MAKEIMEVITNILETESTKIIVGITVAVLSAFIIKFFTSFGGRSKKRRRHLYKLFYKVLLPISKILRHKEFDDINKESMNKLSEIYDNYFHIIPKPLNLRYEDLITEFNKNDLLKRGTYNRYKKHIELMLSDTREKLGFGKTRYSIELTMLPRTVTSFLFIVFIITIFLVELLIFIEPPQPKYAIFLIAFYFIFFVVFIGITVFCKYLKRKVGKFLETFSFDEHPRMTAFERLFKRKTKKILSRLSFYRGTEVNAKNEKDHIDSSKKRTDNQNQSNK